MRSALVTVVFFSALSTVLILVWGCGTESPVLVIDQTTSAYHKPIKIEVKNLDAGQVVTLKMSIIDGKGHKWHSAANYKANDLGVIDLETQPALGGSYTGVHPMGLFWSLTSTDYHQITTSAELKGELEVWINGQNVASDSITRWSTRELNRLGIRHVEKRDSVVANLYLPAGNQIHPAIIFIGGSGGNFREERTSLYASEGIAALDLKYFKGPGLPDGIIEIPLEYVRKAHDWLKQQPNIDPDRIGIAGRSRGSELAMLYATEFDVSYVISQVPSSVVWFGWEDGKSSWTFGERPYPFASYTAEESIRIEMDMKARGVQYHDGPKFESAFSDSVMIAATSIPIEKINCPLLLISGKDDMMWPSTMMADMLVERLERSNFKYEYQHLAYENAGHNFAGGGQGCGIPYLPAEDYSNSTARGGTNEGNSLAAIDSWDNILEFIDRHSK